MCIYYQIYSWFLLYLLITIHFGHSFVTNEFPFQVLTEAESGTDGKGLETWEVSNCKCRVAVWRRVTESDSLTAVERLSLHLLFFSHTHSFFMCVSVWQGLNSIYSHKQRLAMSLHEQQSRVWI